MGRFYNGDINGKFAFGVQASNDADFFGVEGEEPDPPPTLDYYFDEDHLDDIEDGIKECKKVVGKYGKLIDQYFKDNLGYTATELAKAIKCPPEKVGDVLTFYFRLRLGKEILKCVKKNGSCEFEAEC